jgi:hypothetical protein
MAQASYLANLRAASGHKPTVIIFLASLLAGILIQAAFTDYALLAGNQGRTYATIHVTAGALLTLLFSLNLGLLSFKLFSAAQVRKREAGGTFFGGLASVILTGCPACSITLASYLGLSGIIASLPFAGLEIKILGVVVLLISTESLLRKLTTCRLPSAA